MPGLPDPLGRGRFPDTLPGPLQYGHGLQAFIIKLLVAHMLSLRRAVALVQAISGLRLTEATCLGYVRRLSPQTEHFYFGTSGYFYFGIDSWYP